VCQNVPLGVSGVRRPLNVNVGPPIISETTRARNLKLKTQLDVLNYSFGVQNFSARWRTGGAGPGTEFTPDFCISVG